MSWLAKGSVAGRIRLVALLLVLLISAGTASLWGYSRSRQPMGYVGLYDSKRDLIWLPQGGRLYFLNGHAYGMTPSQARRFRWIQMTLHGSPLTLPVGYAYVASLPLLHVALVSLGLATVIVLYPLLPPYKRWDRRRRGLCPQCGYDLRACTAQRCSECGSPFPATLLKQSADAEPTESEEAS